MIGDFMIATNVVRSAFCSLFVFSGTSNPALATDCSAWAQFSSKDPALQPQSVSVSDIQNYINGLATSEGVVFDIEQKDTELWIDIVYVPDNATVISGLRAVMQIGRLVSGDFEKVVLSDDGKGIYQLPEPKVREIGCQFIWGAEGGQNPIYLIRVFFENLELYPDAQRAVSGFTGHLMGDTNVAMEYHNNQFATQWLLSALQ